jgi:hypothetical protein
VLSFLLAFPQISYMHSLSNPYVLHALPISCSFTWILGEEYTLWSSSLCSYLQPPITSSLFGPNILPSNLFSNTLGLFFSLNVKEQVSKFRTHMKPVKIIVSYILIFKFLVDRRNDKRFETLSLDSRCFGRDSSRVLLRYSYSNQLGRKH